jgi:hypothetical protein
MQNLPVASLAKDFNRVGTYSGGQLYSNIPFYSKIDRSKKIFTLALNQRQLKKPLVAQELLPSLTLKKGELPFQPKVITENFIMQPIWCKLRIMPTLAKLLRNPDVSELKEYLAHPNTLSQLILALSSQKKEWEKEYLGNWTTYTTRTDDGIDWQQLARSLENNKETIMGRLIPEALYSNQVFDDYRQKLQQRQLDHSLETPPPSKLPVAPPKPITKNLWDYLLEEP